LDCKPDNINCIYFFSYLFLLSLHGSTQSVLLNRNPEASRRRSLVSAKQLRQICCEGSVGAPGGGPAPHRHDFEESFTLLEGELEFTFRGEKSAVRAGETINIPANAPHSFTNLSSRSV